MKVLAYLRVSTDRQAEEGLGLEVQERAIRAWARKQGHRIVATLRDEGVSGSNGLDSREGLADALQALRSGQAGGLVVYRLDRLARDLIVQETLLAEVRRLKGQVFSTSPSEAQFLEDDPEDPSRKLIRQVLGAVAEYERSMIALRLRSGRRRKREKGGFAFGSPSFGHRSIDGELVPDAGEQKVLKRIQVLRREGCSIRSIAETLTAEGHRAKRGDTNWSPTVVARIVRRTEQKSKHPATGKSLG